MFTSSMKVLGVKMVKCRRMPFPRDNSLLPVACLCHLTLRKTLFGVSIGEVIENVPWLSVGMQVEYHCSVKNYRSRLHEQC